MTPNFTGSMLALAIVLAFVVTEHINGPQQDFETAAEQERREWMHAVQTCHKAYGPSTQPAYDDRGHLVCVSRRGDVLAFTGGQQ